MRISQITLKKRFQAFNRTYFRGMLGLPKFSVGASQVNAGEFSCKFVSWTNNNEVRIAKPKIKLSKRILRDGYQLDCILLHEMIHYYGFLTGNDIEGTHGKWFRQVASEINNDGYDIKEHL